jgi:hypothetical protein
MRFSRPSAGTILGATAVFIALGGTAFAAGATVVNIADPTTPANVAKVDASGKLQTSGSVTNTVNTQQAAPSAYLHTATVSLTASRGCVTFATPPSGKAMVLREVRIDVFSVTSTGAGQNVLIYTGVNCDGFLVGDVNPATVGETVLPFDPGLGIKAGSGLSGFADGTVQAEAYTDGYSVPSAAVPATTVTPSQTQPPHQQ